MLIKALCDYYDILADNGDVLPEGYSNVKVHYLVSLKESEREKVSQRDDNAQTNGEVRN